MYDELTGMVSSPSASSQFPKVPPSIYVFLMVPNHFFLTETAERKYDNDPAFHKFKRQLYHASISAILSSLKPGMTTPVVRRCPDSHFRRVIYDLGPFIADYPEQVLLAGTVQNWCPRFVYRLFIKH
jgi:hypothetical protein